MPTVLVGGPGEWLCRIVCLHFLWRSQNGRPGVQMQIDPAFEMDAAAKVGAGRDENRAATRPGASLDGLVNGRAIQRLAVAKRTKSADAVRLLEAGGGGVGRWGLLRAKCAASLEQQCGD